jgi:predicted NUDIX family NTP pyrophosphohydrolase
MSIRSLDELYEIVLENIQGSSMFSNTGGAHNATAGSSAWSAPKNQYTDEDEEGQGLWQNQLTRLQLYSKS